MGIDPNHLLDRATRSLSAVLPNTDPRQVDLRRAISDCYYAVFHATVLDAVNTFFATRPPSDEVYVNAYRSIKHNWLRILCEQVRGQQVAKTPPHAPHDYFSGNINRFANVVIELYSLREEADYNPSFSIDPTEANVLIEKARDAIKLLQTEDLPKRTAFLTLLLFDIRDIKKN
jgi:uncharacterized protein (UPF0332 family)